MKISAQIDVKWHCTCNSSVLVVKNLDTLSFGPFFWGGCSLPHDYADGADYWQQWATLHSLPIFGKESL